MKAGLSQLEQTRKNTETDAKIRQKDTELMIEKFIAQIEAKLAVEDGKAAKNIGADLN